MNTKMKEIVGNAKAAMISAAMAMALVAAMAMCAWAGPRRRRNFWYNTHQHELIVSTDDAVEADDLCRRRHGSGFILCKGGGVMSYTMTMEPEVSRGAEAYAARRGMTLEGVINAYLVVIAKRAADHTAEREVVRHRPKVSDFIGYGLKFDPGCTSTDEYMREMREGESA